MKIINNFFVLSLFCLSITACSRSETPETNKVDQNIATERETPFLAENEIPAVEVAKGVQVKSDVGIEDVGIIYDEDIYVMLKNSKGSSTRNWISHDPGETPNLLDAFYTDVCGKNSLALVLRQGVNTGVSEGKYYFNALFDPATGEWITTFHGAETKDKDTGEIISDNQKAILTKLKAGITQHCPQILDPNNDKAVEQLLQ